MWKSDTFDQLQVEYGIYSLSIKLKEKKDEKLWWINCIYDPSINSGKSNFWTELNDILEIYRRGIGASEVTLTKSSSLPIEMASQELINVFAVGSPNFL